MKTLHLTSDEMKQFLALPEEIRKSWKAENVTIEYKDSKDRANVRLWQLKVKSPNLLSIAEAAKKGLTLTEMVALMEDLDLSKLPQHDVHELLYAVGPDVLSQIIQGILASAHTQEDLVQAAAYATVRSLFFAPLPT